MNNLLNNFATNTNAGITADITAFLIIPIISLSGLLAGLILSHLAKEELAVGKKYFILFYRIIFIILSFLISYLLYTLYASWFLVFAAFSLFLLLIDLKELPGRKLPEHKIIFLIHYLFFFMGYFIAGQKIIIAALIFLYGLPAGTLLRMNRE